MIIIVGGLLCCMLFFLEERVGTITIMNGVPEISLTAVKWLLRFSHINSNYWHPEPRVLTTAFVGGFI